MRATLFVSAMLLASSSAAFAQSAAPNAASSAPTAAQQAAVVERNQKMVSAALQVTQLVDAGKGGEVWDGASPIAKQIVTRDAFVKQIAADRALLGAPVSRKVMNVAFQISDGKKLPAGVYANVVFFTTFGKAKAPVREMVAFHLESDKTWRVSGYTLR